MLSNSISDEIYHRTLGTLMTTPINSFQVVMGKLLSKLVQLILLMGISLPLLAIVRVFGGVPWEYIISSFFITLTAVIFAGSLSLFFSISSRRSYVVIIKTSFILGILYLFLPVAISVLVDFRYFLVGGLLGGNTYGSAALLFNPFVMMQHKTITMLSPGGAAGTTLWSFWPFHCFIMLIGSGIVLGISVKIVRRVALSQACGQLDLATKIGRKLKRKKAVKLEETTGNIRRVTGRPVLWKELRAPIIKGDNSRNSYIGFIITLVALFLTYLSCYSSGVLDYSSVHIGYVLLLGTIGTIFTAVLSAASITSEKESSTWPILLATSMDDWDILLGKGIGVIRRILPIWFLLAFHLTLFVMIRIIHPVAIFQLLMIAVWVVFFVCGSGLYFSTLFRRTTSAVVANLGFLVFLWLIIPMLLGLTAEIHNDQDMVSGYLSFHPVVQSVVVVEHTCGGSKSRASVSKLLYGWPNKRFGAGKTTLILFVNMVLYISAGVFLAWRAKCRFRRKVF
ncbi:MAG: ABC transporter permease [Planctomycetota bacterium]